MIRKIRFSKTHEILSNLELNFEKEGDPNHVYNTIVFAGENGTGKTTIMDNLSQFLAGGFITPIYSMMYDIDGRRYKIVSTGDNVLSGSHYRGSPEADTRDIKNKDVWKLIDTERGGREFSDKEDIRHYGVAYSTVKLEYANTRLSVDASKVDASTHELDGGDKTTAIKQLLLNLSSKGAYALSDKAEECGEITKTEFTKHKQESDVYRFQRAFNNFFDNVGSDIRFAKVSNLKNKILFKKNDIEVPIEKLSSGEQRIVYRGAYLLKNIKLMSNATILIDEPEMSMHPKWQGEILNYYKGLFKQNDANNVQMFFATHSEKIVESALLDKENTLVIILKRDGSVITPIRITGKDLALSPISAAEVNYMAFEQPSKDLHMLLYVYLQKQMEIEDNIHKFDNRLDTLIDGYVKRQGLDSNSYRKKYIYVDKNGKEQMYKTLPTYIRNYFAHHAEGNEEPTPNELKISIDFLRYLCLDVF